MNILFIHEVDWLKKVVFEIHNLAEILSIRGHRVYAIDYENTWQKTRFWDLGSLKTREMSGISRAVEGSSVKLVRPGFIKIPLVSRISAACTHYFEIKKTLREKKIDVIVLYSVPTNGLQVINIAKKMGIPVVFRSIDMLHGLVRNSLLRSITLYLEKKVYARADLILAITPNHTRYVTGLGADAAKVKLLPLPIDTAIFHPGVKYREVQEKWGLKDSDKVIVFIGTLFDFSGLDGFLRQFPGIAAKELQARLLIVGDGPQRKTLEEIIKELGIQDRVTITGFQPYRTMPQYINLSTVCINTFLDTPGTRDIFPGKIIQYIACGKAAVVTPLLGIKSLIPDETKGVIYAETPAEMAQKVTGLLESSESRLSLERAGLDYIARVHDQKIIGETLEAELQSIVKSRKTKSRNTSGGGPGGAPQPL
jgi:glycosyltransferase involved in cell wall biosynthesis